MMAMLEKTKKNIILVKQKPSKCCLTQIMKESCILLLPCARVTTNTSNAARDMHKKERVFYGKA